MADKDDYLTSYRLFFEKFAATVDPEDQLPVNIAGYTITEAELPGEVIYWTTQYLAEKQCPPTLMTPLQRIILDEVRIASKKHPNEFGYNSDESEYIALRLMQAVTARVNDVCLRYLDNSHLDTLPPPAQPALRGYSTVSAATKNSRRLMEDRHVEIGNLEALFGVETTEPTSFYAVYDGHAGSAAATYCAAHLHQYLVESPHFTKDLMQAMHDAYLRTDAEFIRKSNQKRASGGSTSVTIAVRGRRLVAAWAGDSQALLAKRMRLMQLVNPHKPDRSDEKERIESAGGTVLYWGTWRVNGQLAVSRAIGDAQYKPYVTARPEISVVDLDGDEDFVVVACDGLWDFLSEDVVALSVYKQLMNERDDLKAVPKNLIRQAKKEGSEDNISVIVVFLKDPRDIVADNCPPMDLGLDNAVVNVPPFALENEACKAVVPEARVADCAEGADNGVSDSDSDDLGPETAVDADLDIDDDAELRDEPAPPTPPAHAVESSHVDGNLVDNVAESGEESEDEWNYFKGEGEREQIASEEADEPPRSDTPCQDNSAWESSSVDMNSSPLNPDAPVFIPGGVAGSDVLLAESPRKPVPMDDIELPDVAQFQTEAVVRPAEIQDLDNCDHLNGHHNISMEGVTEHLNGNDNDEMESLGFGFNVGIAQEKIKDTSLIHDFERIQKDTTDFCNIQVFQAHSETNPFSTDGDDELFERLKNKERDPMSMSFYQEKDDDTCERFGKMESDVDLNAVQLLPDSDDEDMQQNGAYGSDNEDKENVCPSEKPNLLSLGDCQEPNNDIMRLDERSDTVANNISNLNSFMDFNVNSTSNMQNYSNTEFECNIQQEVVQTDTPESHKLLFEQIPEIPDGKSSELGFTNEDLLDPSESEKDAQAITPQDETSQEMESKLDESPSEEVQPEICSEVKDELGHSDNLDLSGISDQEEQLDNIDNEILTEPETSPDVEEKPVEQFSVSPEVAEENIIVDVHKNPEIEFSDFDASSEAKDDQNMQYDNFNETLETANETETRLEAEQEIDNLVQAPSSQMLSNSPIHSPAPSESLLLNDSTMLRESPLLQETLAPEDETVPSQESPLPQEDTLLADSPLPQEDKLLQETQESSLLRDSPLPEESLLPSESLVPSRSPMFSDSPIPSEVPIPSDSPIPSEVPIPSRSPVPCDSPIHSELQMPTEVLMPSESPKPSESPLPTESPTSSTLAHVDVDEPTSSPLAKSPLPSESEVSEHIALAQSPLPSQVTPEPQSQIPTTQDELEPPVPAEIPLPRESPLLSESPLPSESHLPSESPLPDDAHLVESTLLSEPSQIKDTPLSASPLPIESISLEQPKVIEAQTESQQSVVTDAQTESQQSVVTDTQTESIPEFKEEMLVSDNLQQESLLPVDDEPLGENIEELPIEKHQEFSEFVQEPSETEEVPKQLLEPSTESPLPVETSQIELPTHVESQECELQRESPLPVESEPVATETLTKELERSESISPAPVEESAPVETTLNTENVTTEVPLENVVPTETIAPIEETTLVASPVPLVESEFESTAKVTPSVEPDIEPCEVSNFEQTAEISAPAPDLVPEERPRNDLVTDIDIGIPESRAQEICVPVTSEIQHEDAVRPGATPPPTPAIGEAPIAAAVAATAAAAATAVAAAATTAKSSSPKKSPTTPTAKPDSKALKSTAARTPASAKRVAPTSAPTRSPATTTARTPAARTSTATAKASPATPRLAAAKPAASPAKLAASPAKPAAAKPAASLAAKPASKATAAPISRTTAAPKTAPAPRPAPKAPAPKPATAAAPKVTAAAPKAAAPKPTARPTPAARPPAAAAPAAKPKEVKPKAPAAPTKPLANGDVKPSAKPAVKAPAARPAPRPAPRPPAPAAAPPKSAAPKPAARAPLDKQSKDLANKRITAKAAPPRTATTKAPVGIKGTTKVSVKKLDNKKENEKPLTNGDGESRKAPPSPPAEGALLPDVIA